MNSLKIFAGVFLVSTTFFGYSLYASTSAEQGGSADSIQPSTLTETKTSAEPNTFSQTKTFTDANNLQEANAFPKAADNAYLVSSVSYDQNAEIRPLLKQAEDAYWKLQLTTPEHDNAYSYYQRVLVIQPGNAAAEVGVQRIVEKYIALANDASRSGRGNTAQGYLQKALTIDPDSARAKDMLVRVDARRVSSPGYATLSSAKEAYRTGRISKPKYQQIVRRLKTTMDGKIHHLKLSYKTGEIDKTTYSQRVRQIKTRYQ